MEHHVTMMFVHFAVCYVLAQALQTTSARPDTRVSTEPPRKKVMRVKIMKPPRARKKPVKRIGGEYNNTTIPSYCRPHCIHEVTE